MSSSLAVILNWVGILPASISHPIFMFNLYFAVWNLLPIPPLDGSKVAADLFPKMCRGVMGLGIWGLLIALFVAFYILPPIAQVLFGIIVGG